MHTLNREVLFSVPESVVERVAIPREIQTTLEAVDYASFTDSTLELLEAQKTFQVWTQTLLACTAVILPQIESVSEAEKQVFSEAFIEALVDFIQHPDHGMAHAYFVYKGMLELYLQERGEQPDDAVATEMQLLALLHDAFQTLPYKVAGENCGIVSKVQKNDHARIVATLMQRFGKHFAIQPEKVRELAFALAEHDSSYQKKIYPDRISFLGSLLHDADKLFGASMKRSPKELARGLFIRNAVANNTQIGAYLFREALTPAYRKKIRYGDRWYSDGFSLALAEIDLQMYSDSAKNIRAERKKVALQELLSVYEALFDSVAQQIQTILIPNLENKHLQLFATAIGHEPYRIETIHSKTDLQEALEQLFETVLTIPEEYQRNSYVTPDATRGWKILALFNNQEIVIDPSIARYCLRPNGKKEFLTKVTAAYLAVVPTETETETN